MFKKLSFDRKQLRLIPVRKNIKYLRPRAQPRPLKNFHQLYSFLYIGKIFVRLLFSSKCISISLLLNSNFKHCNFFLDFQGLSGLKEP